MSSWLLNNLLDGTVRVVYDLTHGIGVKLNDRTGREWFMDQPLSADKTVLVYELAVELYSVKSKSSGWFARKESLE